MQSVTVNITDTIVVPARAILLSLLLFIVELHQLMEPLAFEVYVQKLRWLH